MVAPVMSTARLVRPRSHTLTHHPSGGLDLIRMFCDVVSYYARNRQIY